MRPEKQLLLDEIEGKIKDSKAVIVTKYQKLSPDISWKLSNLAASKNCYFEAVKKRILKKALEKQGITMTMDQLPGHIGLFLMNCDPMEGTKLLFNFKKENGNIFEFISGQFEDKKYSSLELETLAKLPSMNEMRSQLLSIFEAPMTQTLSIMQNVLTGVPYCLENKSQKSSKK